MLKKIDQKTFKTLGIAAIIVLALVRFVIYPLQANIAEKKVIFNELQGTYKLKKQQFERQGLDRDNILQSRTTRDAIAPYIYDKDKPFSSIQADLLENMIKMAEQKGLTVQSFEMMEPAAGKIISDAPVVMRLSGKPADLFDMLKAVVSEGKAIQIKGLEMSKSGKDMGLVLTLAAFRMER